MSRAGRSPTVGVVAGFHAETRCLRGRDVRIEHSGASAERARSQAERLIVDGAAALVSFGLAGGLAPGLRPGHLLLADIVRDTAFAFWSVDPVWRERLRARFAAGGLEAQPGALVGSDSIVPTASAKRALFDGTGAQAVDMESHGVAAAAAAAGIPFLVIRAVADPFDQAIPQAAWEALRPDGRVRVGATFGGLIRQPGELIALLRIARLTAGALTSLRRAAALAGPRMGFEPRSPPG